MITRVDTRLAPALRRSTLPNGLTVLSETMPGVRSVSFGAWVRSASIHERREQMGVSHMLEHMVFKGTRDRSARDLALALEVLGGSLDAYTAREHTSFQARVLDEHLPQAADVIADLIKQKKTLAQIKAARPALPYDTRFGAKTGPWTTDMFVEAIYKSLTAAK